MMITEHNCEDYFLLYLDNELSIAERKMVEVFLTQYPQHTALFKALQDTKLSPDSSTVSFFNKEALYKDETTDIGIANYEEYFLLYTDDELSREQKENTERFVLQHPQLQEEFTLLQQTKLTPEIIEYTNKEELYKKERRVIPMYIAGLCAAAALFAVLFFAGLFTSSQQHSGTIASTSTKPANKPAVQSTQINVSPVIDVHQQKDKSIQLLATDKVVKEKSHAEKAATQLEGSNADGETKSNPLPYPSHQEVATVVPHEETTTPPPASSDNTTTAKQAKQATVLKPLDEDINDGSTETVANLSVSDNNMAQPAVYKELNTDDDSRTLYVSALRLNKNKVNGLLKSASRLLGGRNRSAEE